MTKIGEESKEEKSQSNILLNIKNKRTHKIDLKENYYQNKIGH